MNNANLFTENQNKSAGCPGLAVSPIRALGSPGCSRLFSINSMNDKLDPWLVGGLHPSEIPEIAAAAKRADAQAERLDTPQAVWIRPNSAASIWVNEDSPAERLQGCVMVYSTEDGWIGKD